MTRKDEWREHELQIIYDLVNTVGWFPTAQKLLPCRTENAIRVKMSALRAEAGIVAGVIGPCSMGWDGARRKAAKAASDKLVRAIMEMA